MSSPNSTQWLQTDAKRLAYVHHNASGEAGRTHAPGVLFCGGFNSSMLGNKALFLEEYCCHRGWQYTRFDYRGHGQSRDPSGNSNTHLQHWLEDTVDIIDTVCQGPQIIVGSSMGAWLAIHATLQRASRISGMLGIASAPDFTDELIWQKMDQTARQHLVAGGVWQRPSQYDDGTPYSISMALIESGHSLRVLNAPIAINCPVRLLHGDADIDIPWQYSQRLQQQLTSQRVSLTLVKNADHRLSSTSHLQLIGEHLSGLRQEVVNSVCV